MLASGVIVYVFWIVASYGYCRGRFKNLVLNMSEILMDTNWHRMMSIVDAAQNNSTVL